MAQAPCPMNRTGVVKRTCGFDGTWEPIRSSCTDTELLALSHRAWVMLQALLPQASPSMTYPFVTQDLAFEAFPP